MSAGWAATIREALSRRAPGWAQVGPLKECEERESFSLLAPALSFQPLFFGTPRSPGIRVDSWHAMRTCCFIDYFKFPGGVRRRWSNDERPGRLRIFVSMVLSHSTLYTCALCIFTARS